MWTIISIHTKYRKKLLALSKRNALVIARAPLAIYQDPETRRI